MANTIPHRAYGHMDAGFPLFPLKPPPSSNPTIHDSLCGVSSGAETRRVHLDEPTGMHHAVPPTAPGRRALASCESADVPVSSSLFSSSRVVVGEMEWSH